MGISYREQLGDNRPYWKVIVSLAFSLVGTILFVWIGLELLLYFMPFVIGWFIAYIVSPVVNWLERRLKIVKKLSSALVIILVLAAVVLLLYWAGSNLFREVAALFDDMPLLYRELSAGLRSIGESLDGVFRMLPQGVKEGWHTFVENLGQSAGELIQNLSAPTVTAAGNFAKQIPSILIAVLVTVISAYFFVAEREEVITWAKRVAPDPLVKRMSMVISNLKYAVGGYFKAQFKIMAVVFVILLAGFAIMRLHFAFLLALLIAFLDFLPFFGTGTALIPWAVYHLLSGNYRMVVALLILYAVTQLVHQLIQPKLVGDSIGLKPLLTLVLLYIGYRLGSVLGMILAVPVGMIIINLYKAGAFDYILDDVKILAEGVQRLREK
ncbi:MAG TPA: sporulation integral membrane protein YtvI [Candidatus Dorea gallistercoris]|uniref:Sporulation integral membrane protein YtvI n=1 Tax=Candidatus Dorea gallistercoris TaxID=2838542 RepID=A0A9D1RBT1_9FIRM|nr:sporulation integral membrane protein YtvI [Candidatus Dorea gallistercoris]